MFVLKGNQITAALAMANDLLVGEGIDSIILIVLDNVPMNQAWGLLTIFRHVSLKTMS